MNNSNNCISNNHNSISGPHQQQQHQYGVKQFSISVEEQYYTQSQVESSSANVNTYGENGFINNVKSQDNITRPGSSAGSITGPKLVNKQLVLPFVPPTFPNNSTDGANHLIKPSEYLKSITDKKSIAGSTR